MKLIVIDWNKQAIEEYETDSIFYEEDGVSYTTWIYDGHKIAKKVPYKNLLGVKYD